MIKDDSLKYGYMKTVSIGYKREDGDFAVLATLNNNDEHWNPYQFDWIVNEILWNARNFAKIENIEVLERQDSPDYVDYVDREDEIKPQLESYDNPQDIIDKVEQRCQEESIVLINKSWGENGKRS